MIKNKELEEKPLYSTWDYKKVPQKGNDLFGEPINMFCHICENNQTFNCRQIVFDDSNITDHLNASIPYSIRDSFDEGILTLNYTCTHCNTFKRNFTIRVQKDGKMEKIGQYPPLDIIIPKEIKSLGKKDVEKIYQRGKISENLGYGIGAFAYYRRVVELCINKLIDEIEEIIPLEKKEEYQKIVKKLKEEKTAEKRIDLIKDTIVDTSIYGNPLSKIYEISSIGIHGLSDEECLEYANSLRTLLLYIIDEISREKNKKDGLRKAMDKIEKLISKKV